MAFLAQFFRTARRPPSACATPFAQGVDALERRCFDEALTHFSAALAVAASTSEAAVVHNRRGLVFLQRGQRELAIDAFCEALTSDAQCVAAIINVGNLLLEDAMFDEAIVHYEAALRIDDTNAAAQRNLGIAFKRLGRRADAVRQFRRADRLDARLRKH